MECRFRLVCDHIKSIIILNLYYSGLSRDDDRQDTVRWSSLTPGLTLINVLYYPEGPESWDQSFSIHRKIIVFLEFTGHKIWFFHALISNPTRPIYGIHGSKSTAIQLNETLHTV